jgi:RimJ/RimL family protein N-acetyltransferase
MLEYSELTDGVITLRRRTLADVNAHVQGQDDAISRWLDWDAPTVENVTAMIEQSNAAWESQLRRYEFGISDASRGHLQGICLANCLDPLLEAGDVNLAYVVFPNHRGQGLAGRAIELLCGWVANDSAAETAVLKIDDDNTASRKVAAKHGFIAASVIETPTGWLRKYVRPLGKLGPRGFPPP